MPKNKTCVDATKLESNKIGYAIGREEKVGTRFKLGTTGNKDSNESWDCVTDQQQVNLWVNCRVSSLFVKALEPQSIAVMECD